MAEITQEMSNELVKRVIAELMQQEADDSIRVYIVLQKMSVYTRSEFKLWDGPHYDYNHRSVNRFVKVFKNKEDAIMYALREDGCFVEEVVL